MICLTDEEYDEMCQRDEQREIAVIRNELKGIEAMVGALQQIEDLKKEVAYYRGYYDRYWELRRELDSIYTDHV